MSDHSDAEAAFVVAVLGAESTGKTVLCRALVDRLCAQGRRAVLVTEVLREFCDQHARTPLRHEQRGIAREQARRIEQARAQAEIVVADTSPVMTAVYSGLVFGDASLDEEALAGHQAVNLTLLTALDLPWVADGIQRDGEHVRLPVDLRIRDLLGAAGVPYALVAGQGDARLAHAWQTLSHALARHAAPKATQEAAGKRWRWVCESCDDADCERHWLPRSPTTSD